MNWLKQNWPKVSLGIFILIVSFLVKGADKPEPALISDPIQSTAIVADNVITGNYIKGTKIVWDGVVVENLTYGRIRVEKIPIDNNFPNFIVEEYDAKSLHQEHGTKIRVWGEVEGVDVCLKCEEDPYVPWVLVERIENI